MQARFPLIGSLSIKAIILRQLRQKSQLLASRAGFGLLPNTVKSLEDLLKVGLFLLETRISLAKISL